MLGPGSIFLSGQTFSKETFENSSLLALGLLSPFYCCTLSFRNIIHLLAALLLSHLPLGARCPLVTPHL